MTEGSHFRRADPRVGYVRFCSAGRDLESLTFGTCNLEAGQRWKADAGGEEALAVVLRGRVDVRAGEREFRGLGGRRSVFAGRATSILGSPKAVGLVRA